MKNKLHEFRSSKGISQQQASKQIGVSLSLYTKIECGFRNPSYNFIKKFKQKFPDADIEGIFFVND